MIERNSEDVEERNSNKDVLIMPAIETSVMTSTTTTIVILDTITILIRNTELLLN